MLNFSTVREGDNVSLIEREVMLWNERDRAGWLALADLPRAEVTAPGGPAGCPARRRPTRSGTPGTRPSRTTG